jgi:hypothetical protein
VGEKKNDCCQEKQDWVFVWCGLNWSEPSLNPKINVNTERKNNET